MSKNISGKQALIIIPSVFIAIIVIAGLIAESGEPDVASPTVATTQETAVFDIPSLIDKDIDGVRAEMGTPVDKDLEPTAQQLQFGTTEWYNSFERNGQSLLVTFNPKTRTIIDFFISTNDSSGATRNKEALLSIGNLNEGNSNYQVEFVSALNNRTSYTGVKIIPR